MGHSAFTAVHSRDAGDKYVGLDRFGRVVDVRWKTSSADLDRFQYGYDRNSSRLWRDNLVSAAHGELYTYDGLNQLDSFGRGTLNGTRTGFTGSASRTQGWTPDAAGNFSTVTTNGTGQTRTHNRQNQITALGSATPTYDADGNLTGDGTWTMTYDAWNRVITLTAGANNATYKYDALSRRISEEGTPVTVLGPLHLYYNAAWQVIEERWTYFNEDTLIGGGGGEGGGGMAPESFTGPNVSARYVWSPVSAGDSPRRAGIDTMVLRDRDTTADGVPDERLYVQQDAQSNVTALVNTSGAVVERSIQDPYGVRTLLTAGWSSRSATLYDWKYYHQGLRLDWTQTLYDNRMRMYSPTLMRFLQNDPIGFAAGDQNTYRYVGNGPMGRMDPSGLQVVMPGGPFPIFPPVTGSIPGYNGQHVAGAESAGNVDPWTQGPIDPSLLVTSMYTGLIPVLTEYPWTLSIGYGGDLSIFYVHVAVSFDLNIGWSPQHGFTMGPGFTIAGGPGLGLGFNVGPHFTVTDAETIEALEGPSNGNGIWLGWVSTGGATLVNGNGYGGITIAPPIPPGIGFGGGIYCDQQETFIWTWVD